jgi:SAM-dependent methyltransferase
MPTEAIYVQYGCGFSAGPGWQNFDNSPTLFAERIPGGIGRLASALLSGNAQRFPRTVQYGDIRKGLPIRDGVARGCFASHVLEHLSLEDLRSALANTHRMLEPGGVFRLIVPDLYERARRYVAAFEGGDSDAAIKFISETMLGRNSRPRGVLEVARAAIGGSAHLWMWDAKAMAAELAKAGFVSIRSCKFGDSDDPMFARVERLDRFVDQSNQIAECALEARKPKENSENSN